MGYAIDGIFTSGRIESLLKKFPQIPDKNWTNASELPCLLGLLPAGWGVEVPGGQATAAQGNLLYHAFDRCGH
jgi:hypothetical protein